MSLRPTAWSAELATGIAWQDQQHQSLLRCLHNLYDSIFNLTERKEVLTALDFLDGYVLEHFGLEEKYMKELNYPDARYHKAEHDEFRKNYRFLQESYRNPSELSAALLCYDLNEWIVNHLKTTDQRLGEFLQGKC